MLLNDEKNRFIHRQKLELILFSSHKKVLEEIRPHGKATGAIPYNRPQKKEICRYCFWVRQNHRFSQ